MKNKSCNFCTTSGLKIVGQSSSFADIVPHAGHKLRIVPYGDDDSFFAGLGLECTDCAVRLLEVTSKLRFCPMCGDELKKDGSINLHADEVNLCSGYSNPPNVNDFYKTILSSWDEKVPELVGSILDLYPHEVASTGIGVNPSQTRNDVGSLWLQVSTSKLTKYRISVITRPHRQVHLLAFGLLGDKLDDFPLHRCDKWIPIGMPDVTLKLAKLLRLDAEAMKKIESICNESFND